MCSCLQYFTKRKEHAWRKERNQFGRKQTLISFGHRKNMSKSSTGDLLIPYTTAGFYSPRKIHEKVEVGADARESSDKPSQPTWGPSSVKPTAGPAEQEGSADNPSTAVAHSATERVLEQTVEIAVDKLQQAKAAYEAHYKKDVDALLVSTKKTWSHASRWTVSVFSSSSGNSEATTRDQNNNQNIDRGI